MKDKKQVALIFGGTGCEHAVSVAGAKNLYPRFDREKFRVLPVIITKEGKWLTDEGYAEKDLDGFLGAVSRGNVSDTFPVRLGEKRGFISPSGIIECSCAFPLLHGDGGEDGVIQGALRTAGIPFVGCDTQASAVCADKGFTKAVARWLNIPVVPWIYACGESAVDFVCLVERTLGYPVFVKPARLGSSVGAGIARSRPQLMRVYKSASELGGGRVIAERYVEGARELECAYFSVNGKVLFTNPGEIISSGGFYDYGAKYTEESSAKVSTDCHADDEVKELIRSYAQKLCRVLGCVGVSRVDFFLDRDGKIYFNEINTMPGMTDTSLYPRLLSAYGISVSEMLTELMEDSWYAGDI